MTLKAKIQNDMIGAMKAKEDLKVSTLRMLKAAVLKLEVSVGRNQAEANDGEVVDLIKKEIKQRRDSAEQFRSGGRAEMAEKEEAEIKILEKYMPAQMSEAEIEAVVREVIAQTGAQSAADFGKVMGVVMGRVKGMADGAVVKSVVERVLIEIFNQ